ncbi:IS256 family transposase, partial [Paenarthrobacter ureafaciens]|nr:IS256 family transposase [Paenarthrobacter ureafaciens]
MNGACNSSCCQICGEELVKNGRTSAGRQRWRCKSCGSSSIRNRPDVTRRAQLDAFLGWLLGKQT